MFSLGCISWAQAHGTKRNPLGAKKERGIFMNKNVDTDTSKKSSTAVRPIFTKGILYKISTVDDVDEIVRPVSLWEKITGIGALRKLALLFLLAVLWQSYAMLLENPLMFPTLIDTVTSFWEALYHGELLRRIWVSISTLLLGYAIGVIAATILSVLAVSTRLGSDLLEILTAMFNPLPAIALLPLALLWFGLGKISLIFVLVHAVVWPVSLNTHSGFTGVSQTLRMVGRNCGLRGLGYVSKILIPAALPSILTGLKVGWAFAWRTLIAAELVFGVTSGSGGLGWFIYVNKAELEIAYVFAGLFSVILIGMGVDRLVFRNIASRTVIKWGMQVS
jgi:NitT/TauT family transport system permease protein